MQFLWIPHLPLMQYPRVHTLTILSLGEQGAGRGSRVCTPAPTDAGCVQRLDGILSKTKRVSHETEQEPEKCSGHPRRELRVLAVLSVF